MGKMNSSDEPKIQLNEDPFIKEMQAFVAEQGTKIKNLEASNAIFLNLISKMKRAIVLNHKWLSVISSNDPVYQKTASKITEELNNLEAQILAELKNRNI